jgi:uncharacterized membrane protein
MGEYVEALAKLLFYIIGLYIVGTIFIVLLAKIGIGALVILILAIIWLHMREKKQKADKATGAEEVK